MEPCKKKKRLQSSENENGTIKSDAIKSSAFSQDNSSTFPSLAFSVFIETVTDIKLLKICRSVCKSWNIPASSVLKARSCVRLDESQLQSSINFKILLDTRKTGPNDLPSPFKHLNVKATSFTEDCFKKILALPYLVISTITFSITAPNLDQRALAAFLVTKGMHITALKINATRINEGFTLDNALMNNDHIRLSSLKRLRIYNVQPVCNHMELIKRFIQHSSLERIHLGIADARILAQLFTNNSMKNVKSIVLSVCPLSTEQWALLGGVTFPELKELTFRTQNEENETEQVQQFSMLVQNVSRTITVLSSNLIRMGLLPPCPKLREIILTYHNERLSEITRDKFPSLEAVTIPNLMTSWSFLETNFAPHTGVRKIVLNVGGSERHQQDFGLLHLHIFLKNLSIQFPNTEGLSLGIHPFNFVTFRDIHHSFPGLKTLEITSSCDFLSISGMRIDVIQEYLEAGWAIESVPRRDSILDFVALETVYLGKEVRVTNDMITYCFSKIPTLKSLAFFWNINLSAQEVRDRLGHLDKISVYGSAEQSRQAMGLLDTMRNVRLY